MSQSVFGNSDGVSQKLWWGGDSYGRYGTPFTLKNITGQYQAIIKGQALY